MRINLVNARTSRNINIDEICSNVGISERMYRYLESGQRDGKYWIWDNLEDFFGISQRTLRENTPHPNNNINEGKQAN